MVSASRPGPSLFVDFRLWSKGSQLSEALSHPAFAWMAQQAAYRRAEEAFKRSAYYHGLAPGRLLRVQSGTVIAQHGMQDLALLEFAQRVAFCLGHFFEEQDSKVWVGGAKRRSRAARDFGTALGWLKKGYGPYGREDKDELANLLQAARAYLKAQHVSKALRLKGGVSRAAGMLVRELALYVGEWFDLGNREITNIASEVLVIAGVTDIDRKTISEHVKSARAA